MSKIIKVELILENCETIVIEEHDLLIFELYEYSQRVSIFGKWAKCKGFIIVATGYSKEESCINSNGNMFERLQKYKDITSIYVTYENNEIEHIYNDWSEDDTSQGQYNHCQNVQFINDKVIISQDMGLCTPEVKPDLEFIYEDLKCN